MRVLVAMSGGVDSSVSAYLLKERGFDVIGIFIRSGVETEQQNVKSCCSIYDAYDARRVADQLNIPFYSLNFKPEFDMLIDYFVNEYDKGRTPNPCVLCNRLIKFGRLFEFADAVEAEFISTGHYARIEKDKNGYVLKKGLDLEKEQSYMLALVEKKFLGRIILPLGELTKKEVREIARKAKIKIAEKADSQDICFVPDNDYKKLLLKKIPHRLQKGNIVDTEGKTLQTHDGYQLFTIGQRRGLKIASGKPLFVIKIVPSTNTVMVAEEHMLYSHNMQVEDINWLVEPPEPGRPIQVEVRIRYRGSLSRATLIPVDEKNAEVKFETPVRAVTPGQLAVFYKDDIVLGGGWIR